MYISSRLGERWEQSGNNLVLKPAAKHGMSNHYRNGKHGQQIKSKRRPGSTTDVSHQTSWIR
jgi:hypothetical protein